MPNQEVPQQMHFDVGEAAVLDLGATKHDYQWRGRTDTVRRLALPMAIVVYNDDAYVPRCTT